MTKFDFLKAIADGTIILNGKARAMQNILVRETDDGINVELHGTVVFTKDNKGNISYNANYPSHTTIKTINECLSAFGAKYRIKSRGGVVSEYNTKD